MCAQANSASYPQRDWKWVVAHGLWGEGQVRWLGQWYVCVLHRGSSCSPSRAVDDRIMCHGIISSCQSTATSEIVKRCCSSLVSSAITSNQTFTFPFFTFFFAFHHLQVPLLHVTSWNLLSGWTSTWLNNPSTICKLCIARLLYTSWVMRGARANLCKDRCFQGTWAASPNRLQRAPWRSCWENELNTSCLSRQTTTANTTQDISAMFTAQQLQGHRACTNDHKYVNNSIRHRRHVRLKGEAKL